MSGFAPRVLRKKQKVNAPPASVAAPQGISAWEALAVDSVGDVIEFWGFKRNQGRVWGLLYLRDASLSAREIELLLKLSKGGVSMLLNDMERWGVVQRSRLPGDGAWRYRACIDVIAMTRNVIETRELNFIAKVRVDLAQAHVTAKLSGANGEHLVRLERIQALAQATDNVLRLVLKVQHVNLRGLFKVFRGGAQT